MLINGVNMQLSSIQDSLSSLSLESSPVLSPRKPRPRSGKNLLLLSLGKKPEFSDVKAPTGEESGQELKDQLAHYEQRRQEALSEIARLEGKPALTNAETENLSQLKLYEKTLSEAIDKTGGFLRKSSRAKRKSFKNISLRDLQENRARYLQQGHEQRNSEVQAIVKRLQEVNEARAGELEARLKEISRIILGKPSETGAVTKISTSITELWRTAPTTIIIESGQRLQEVHPEAHNREKPVDERDAALRFQLLFSIFLRYTKERTTLPDTTGWNYNSVVGWTEREGETLEKVFNEKMRRFLRSSSQALFTGSLSHKDVLEHAPNLPGTDNKLYATVTAGGQEIERCFFNDGSSEINIMLPYELKNRTGGLFAKIIASYCIGFDDEMQPVSLKSRVDLCEVAQKP